MATLKSVVVEPSSTFASTTSKRVTSSTQKYNKIDDLYLPVNYVGLLTVRSRFKSGTPSETGLFCPTVLTRPPLFSWNFDFCSVIVPFVLSRRSSNMSPSFQPRSRSHVWGTVTALAFPLRLIVAVLRMLNSSKSLLVSPPV